MSAASPLKCPHCGADNAAETKHCWLCRCGLAVPPVRERAGAVRAELATSPPKFVPSPVSFSLAAIFAVVTLAAVGFGLARIEPGFGIAFGVIAVPAFIITAVRTRREQNLKGRKVGLVESVLTFLVSSAAVFGIVMLIQIAIVIALFIACLAICGGMMAIDALSR
jgi:hypothetical protein